MLKLKNFTCNYTNNFSFFQFSCTKFNIAEKIGFLTLTNIHTTNDTGSVVRMSIKII
jgi:hypothetical protein